MKYFKYRWEETRDDSFDDWGFSTWYSELGEDFFPTRQIEVYDNGIVLKYDNNHLEDEFGMLCDQSLEEDELKNSFEISQDEFENFWNSLKAFNK